MLNIFRDVLKDRISEYQSTEIRISQGPLVNWDNICILPSIIFYFRIGVIHTLFRFARMVEVAYCTGKSLSSSSFCRTWWEHVVYKNCSKCQKLFLYTTCSSQFELGIFIYWTCNSMSSSKIQQTKMLVRDHSYIT